MSSADGDQKDPADVLRRRRQRALPSGLPLLAGAAPSAGSTIFSRKNWL